MAEIVKVAYPQTNYLAFFGATNRTLNIDFPLQINKRIFKTHIEFYNKVHREILPYKYLPLACVIGAYRIFRWGKPFNISVVACYAFTKLVSYSLFPQLALKLSLNERIDLNPMFDFFMIKKSNIELRKMYLERINNMERKIQGIEVQTKDMSPKDKSARFLEIAPTNK